jgi:hypothetical protein
MTQFLWRSYKNQKLVFSPLYLYYQERAMDGIATTVSPVPPGAAGLSGWK